MVSHREGGNSTGRALVVVSDGLGFDPEKTSQCIQAMSESLDNRDQRAISSAAHRCADSDVDPELLAKLVMMPVTAEGLTPELTWRSAEYIAARAHMARKLIAEQGIAETIASHRARVANQYRYVPWCVKASEWCAVLNANLAVPTHASGIWVGYEDLEPPVQGNSETGHQQIGNLALAPQIPLQITRGIADGSFYSNRELVTAIQDALSNGSSVNFCFLLSGIDGSDGRVHSAWNHLEAFCELVFSRIGASPQQVRMQAILDGRDAPATGSLELPGPKPGFLYRLEELLQRFNAVESLAWIIGRSMAMDRDYREENARADYQLLTAAQGESAASIEHACRIIAETHRQGQTDADVPPIVLAHGYSKPPTVKHGDAFVNLNFRSDRQRAKTASLCGAESYLQREAKSRGRRWKMGWMQKSLELRMCTIAEYDDTFQDRYGVRVAYPIQPHRLSFLSQWDRLMPPEARYLLVAESVKASHMGYFVRGRRESPEAANAEDRIIIPSAGADEDIRSDSDFYRVPEMQNRRIVAKIREAMARRQHSLIMCNLAAPDMVGHLLPKRFEQSIQAYASNAQALFQLHIAAKANGYSMVVTSDHGNIENDTPTHTANPVLTAVIPAGGRALPRALEATFSATLFDITHTAARLLGIDGEKLAKIVADGRDSLPNRFIGKSIIR